MCSKTNLPEEEPDYYINGEGNLVFTRSYHLRRGYCCGNGCLHCPYQDENIPEKDKPKTSRPAGEKKRE